MPKYLLEVSYTTEGTKGVLKEGGSKRRAAAEKAFKGVGGKIEAWYYALGKNDLYVIADFPDNVSAAAAALVVNSAGGAIIRTTVLLTNAEIDKASRKTLTYRPPGH
jgi:uncharacterized protein with GYD domain